MEIDYPLLESLASPCRLKSQRMAGIRLENDRIIRLLEILMHSAGHIGGMNAADIHRAVLQAYQLTSEQYTRNQLAYDLRKLKAHGLIERPDNRYVYVLSDYRRNAAGCSGVQSSEFRVQQKTASSARFPASPLVSPEH